MASPAEAYERSIVPYLFQPWAARLVEQVAPAPEERVLDVACGTGIVAREVASRVGRDGDVTGADPNPDMLAIARRESESAGFGIRYHEAAAQTLPLADGAADVVFCQQGLQFTPDRAAAVREMHRVLAPGGRIAISVWRDLELHPFFAALDEVMRRRLEVGAASMPFSLPDAEALRGLLTDAGFVDVDIERPSMPARYPDPDGNLYETIHALVAVVPSLQTFDAAERERMIDEISAEMRDVHRSYVEGEHVVLPWHANVAFARRAA